MANVIFAALQTKTKGKFRHTSIAKRSMKDFVDKTQILSKLGELDLPTRRSTRFYAAVKLIEAFMP